MAMIPNIFFEITFKCGLILYYTFCFEFINLDYSNERAFKHL